MPLNGFPWVPDTVSTAGLPLIGYTASMPPPAVTLCQPQVSVSLKQLAEGGMLTQQPSWAPAPWGYPTSHGNGVPVRGEMVPVVHYQHYQPGFPVLVHPNHRTRMAWGKAQGIPPGPPPLNQHRLNS